MKLTMDDVVIEVTRRCNMQCGHCLRGPAQNLNMTQAYVDQFMGRVDYISNLTLSGGEPSLVPLRLNMVLDSMKRHRVGLGSFGIVTNGKKISSEFVMACVAFYAYSDEREMCMVSRSTDQFHESVNENSESIQLLQALRFYEERGRIDYPISEGRYSGSSYRRPHDHGFGIDDNRIGDQEVYLNCRGNIIAGCDWSYRSQAHPSHIVCPVPEMSLEKFEAFNQRLEQREAA